MGDVTEENGDYGMHVTDLSFADAKNGTVTVSVSRSGEDSRDTLSAVFTTTDGGENFTAVTSGDPAVRAASGETENGVVVRQRNPADSRSADLQEKEVTLEAGQQRQM